MSRNYIIVTKNVDGFKEKIEKLFEEGIIRRYVFQVECGGTTDYVHIQGYAVFKKTIKIPGVKKLFRDNEMHLEPKAKDSTEQQAADYCRKEETRLHGPYEQGDFKTTQGKRNDLLEVQTRIQEGATELEIADDFWLQWVQYHRAFTLYRQLRAGAPRDGKEPMVVKYWWGNTGTGKTRGVYEQYGVDEVYVVTRPTNGSLYYDNYTGQTCILYDDYLGWAPLSHMLNVLDRYPMQLKVHGGMVHFLASTTTIIITSNKRWDELYNWPNEQLKQAFKRRITEVREFI